MDSQTAFGIIKTLQQALRVLVFLQLTGYMWPQHSDVPDGASFDFIVVGAGTAGSVVANRLSENLNVNVLLIEAGGDPPLESEIPGTFLFMMKETRHDWNFTAEPDKYIETCHQRPYLEASSGKMLGGSSSMNYLLYSRGFPEDYNSWATLLGDDMWKWENVLPYFKKAENVEDSDILKSPADKPLYGIDGYFKVSSEKYKDDLTYFKICNEMGYESVPDLNENHPLGCTRMKIALGDGTRQSSANAYLSLIKDRENLHVMKNTYATKILFDDSKNAVGVEAMTIEGGTVTYKATQEIIVSAGAFNSPKLLMLSGVGPKEQLESNNIAVVSDLPVGDNLQDHVSTIIVHKTDKINTPPQPWNPHEYPAPTIVSRLALNKSQGFADYEVTSFLIREDIVLFYCSFNYRFKHEICDDIYKSVSGKKAIFHRVNLLNPKSRGKVTLKSSDPVDHPVIKHGHLSNAEDLENALDYLLDFARIVNTTSLKNVNADLAEPIAANCGHLSKDSREFWRCYSSCMFIGNGDFVGTCAMGSVVDSNLKVIGVKRLRVVDASVMPTITSTGVMGPIIMIGEKAADFIRKEHGID